MKKSIVSAVLVLALLPACKTSTQLPKESNSGDISQSEINNSPSKNEDDSLLVPVESEVQEIASISEGNNVAMEAYKAVLRGDATFHDTGTEKDLDVAHICEVFNPEVSLVSLYFTTIDLDSDGMQEVILMLDSYARYGYEILHYQNGAVYGYYMIPRGFEELKLDGTYEGSSSAFSGTIKRIESFSENGLSEQIVVEYDYHTYDYDDENELHEYFMINGEKSSSIQIEGMLDQQYAKNSTEWYDVTEENIGEILF